jgi:hypothetical protein
MTIHTVIESLSAYQAVRAADPKGPRVWWTTSPFLLILLPKRGETVHTPERGLSEGAFNGLGLACRDVTDDFCAWLDTRCGWREYAQFRTILPYALFRFLFVSLYKGMLLDRILQAAKGTPIACVGDSYLPPLRSFALTYSRFDTLFAAIAAESCSHDMHIVTHRVSQEQKAQLNRAIVQRTMAPFEKLLSLVNNTPSSFCFKLWQKMCDHGIWPLPGIQFRPFPAKTFHLHKPCELIEESFLGILLRGGRIKQLPRLPQPDLSTLDPISSPDFDEALSFLRQLIKPKFLHHGVAHFATLSPALEVAGRYLMTVIEGFRQNLPAMTESFQAITRCFGPRDEIITQSFTGLVDRLFYCFCKSRKIRVNAFEHGVTHGLSEWSKAYAHQASIIASQSAFYHCPRGIDAVSVHAEGQEAFAVGLPRVTQRVNLRKLQRRLARAWLKIRNNESVVMYVSDLEKNNYIYGPYNDNDFQFLEKTRDVVSHICQSMPSSHIILKLYPTQRYLDQYGFEDLRETNPNLTIVKDIDFRFIRSAADFILVSSTQSTLGWVAGSGVPFLYLDFAWSPGLIKGLKLSIPGIPGLVAAIIPDSGEICRIAPRSPARILMTRSMSERLRSTS